MTNKKKQITPPAPIVYMLNNVMPVCYKFQVTVSGTSILQLET